MGNTSLETLKVKHSANSGDVIYSQWTCKKIWERYGLKIDYYQQIGRPGIYYDGATHPIRNEKGEMVTMNHTMFKMLKPLIERMPWINSFNIYSGQEQINIDLDEIRDENVNMPFGDIRKWYGYVFPDVQVDIGSKLFDFVFNNYKVGVSNKIIINRSERYRNLQIDYGFLNHYDNLWFTGTTAEYEEMMQWVPDLNYLEVIDFSHLAEEISRCRFFVGNQSFCFSIAEAIKVPRVLEVCSYAPNVIVAGENGRDFLSQAAFKIVVDDLYHLTK